MRKWIIDSDEPGAVYKLLASWSRPDRAYCEAPDFFTRDMEPYIVLGQDSEDEIVAVLSDKYFEEHELKNEGKQILKELDRAELLLALKKAEDKKKFNELPWHKRVLRSFLKEKPK